MPIEVTLKVSDQDADRIMQAIKDGKLAYLGITNAAMELPSGKTIWANPDLKHATPPDKPGRESPSR